MSADYGAEPLVILIAEDNPSDRLILQQIIIGLGHSTVTAENGRQALDLFRDRRPDIILMDAVMPVMSGLEATRQIKQEMELDLVPVIFLTALHKPAELAECIDAGGDDFLSKPFSPVILKAKLNAAVRMRDLNRRINQQNETLQVEQQLAKTIFDRVSRQSRLNRPDIRFLMSPKSTLNGDTILVADRPNGGINVFLGDFTGHGLAAAIGVLPLSEIFYRMTASGHPVQSILLEINRKLQQLLPANFFCAAAMAEFSPDMRSSLLWVGGIPDVILYKSDNCRSKIYQSNHLPLGILSADQFSVNMYELSLSAGDRLFLWSDGLHEAVNSNDEMFGEQRVNSIFNRGLAPDALFDELIRSMDDYTGTENARDDLTLLEFRVPKPPKPLQKLAVSSQDSKTSAWQLRFSLDLNLIRQYDPVPGILAHFTETPGLSDKMSVIYTLLNELFSNALEHGLLRLNSSMKKDAEGFAEYYREREHRLNELDVGRIIISLDHRPIPAGGKLSISITDSGPGFDYNNLVSSFKGNNGYSGRGLALVNQLADRLQFSDSGREATAQVFWSYSAGTQDD